MKSSQPPMPSPSMVYENHLFIISMPHSRVLKLISRSIFLSLLIILFPWIQSLVLNSNKAVTFHENQNGASKSTYLPLLFQDLFNQGLLKSGDQALLNGDEDKVGVGGAKRIVLIDDGIDFVAESFRQNLIGDDSFDFIINSGCCVSEFVERTLKVGGIVVVELGGHPISSKAFKLPSNYKIVYIRRFSTTIVAMRKLSTNGIDKSINNRVFNSRGRRLLSNFESHPKRTASALDGLEDVMFEPPREKDYLRKINYLPDLTRDSLDTYPRRVFIDVALSGNSNGSRSSVKWFRKNYPTRNTKFDIYTIEIVLAEESADVPHPMVSEWLWNNVDKGEYVVMKAEASAVEEMLDSGAISLVDELFLECNHEWQKGRKNEVNPRRPYWECLALYGRVRDEGIAVHQWWECNS